jgi:rSAM/selenodomain-associated transferase 2
MQSHFSRSSPAPHQELLQHSAAATHPNATVYRCASNDPVGSLCNADYLAIGMRIEGTGLRNICDTCVLAALCLPELTAPASAGNNSQQVGNHRLRTPIVYSLKPASSVQISVIIPTLNEAANIEAALQSTRDAGDVQTIVVDGGSSDDTLARSAAADIVLSVAPGRGGPQTAGAAVATGEILLFLHADCRLEPGCLEAARAVCAAPDCVGGCFRQHVNAKGWRYRALEWGNALRVRCLRLAYGDQGIFVKADVFHRLGGFPPLKFMEDLFLMKRLRREGRFVLLDRRIHVSARRWQQRGVVRQTVTNWALVVLAQCGVAPERLVTFYDNQR